MKQIVLAFVAIAVIAIGANYALQEAGFSAADQTTSSGSVRLD